MLSDKQLASIDLMVAGRKGVDIEKEINISHTQLFRWKHEPEFLAHLEEARAQAHEERVDRLWRTADRAMDVALECLDEGDPNMARDMIKLVAGGLVDVRRVPLGEVPAPASPPPARLGPGDGAAGYPCETCDKEFRSAGALASHLRTHAT